MASPEPTPERIPLAAAIKLARGKPEKGFTRSDLIVYGGWLNTGWSWSRDIEIPLEKAIENATRLGERVQIIGKARPDGKAMKKKKSGGLRFGSVFRRRPKRVP